MFQENSMENFESLVRRYYKFLESDFGFSIQKLRDDAFVVEKHNVKISIYLEYGVALIVEIVPTKEAATQLLKQNIFPEPLDVLSVSKYYNPALQYENFINDNIPNGLEKRAALINEYLGKMLHGDFSDWPKIGKYLSRITYGKE
jgi:hypothetical protein